jgi:hypothetical protein
VAVRAAHDEWYATPGTAAQKLLSGQVFPASDGLTVFLR